MLGSTLILTWIPNSTLKKNPRSIEHSPAQTRVTPRRSPRQEYAHIEYPTSAAQSPTNSTVDVDVTDDCNHRQSVSSAVDSQGDVCTVRDNASETGDNTTVSEIGCESINNVKPSCTPTNTCRARVGVNVNPLRDKCTNLLMQNNAEQTASEKGDTVSDGSHRSVAASRQLAMLSSRSDSSNKSVASVEMDGDNLVIVTEEILNDEAFLDPTENCAVESVLPEQYRETMDKLTAAASKAVGDDMQRLRHSLDLQLNLTHDNDLVEKVSDFDFEITGTSLNARIEETRNSSSTSGPDSVPPSPSEIPDVPNLSSPEASNDTFGVTQQHDADFVKHCLSFPENAVDYTAEKPSSDSNVTFRSAAEQVCGVFSVDLGTYTSMYSSFSFLFLYSM